MEIRESQFIEPSKESPRFSRFELDFYYAEDYRLSLRFNYESKRYQIFKYNAHNYPNHVEVCYTYVDLGLALRLGNKLANEYHKDDHQKDEAIYDLTREETVPKISEASD